MDVRIEESWKKVLEKEFEKPYFVSLAEELRGRKRSGEIIYPPGKEIFRAFEITPFDKVKVVLLGQDPYHGAGQAMGLSFSVPENIPPPPSLKNIFKEIETDLGVKMSGCPNLEKWGKQGVLLLNSVLTVRQGVPASHKDIGWQHFTDAVIAHISEEREGIVFLLWGNSAKSKECLVDASKHLVLTAAHPSPLAGGAFFGCRHFSKTNDYLLLKGKTPIDWKL